MAASLCCRPKSQSGSSGCHPGNCPRLTLAAVAEASPAKRVTHENSLSPSWDGSKPQARTCTPPEAAHEPRNRAEVAFMGGDARIPGRRGRH